MKKLIFTLLFIQLFNICCTKIEDLSGDNSISSVEIISHSPSTIVLDDVRISADTIYLPIKYGKYEFPLNVYANIEVARGAYIYGIKANESITFENIESPAHRFVISSEGGASKNYYIVPLEIALDESTDVYDAISFSDPAPELLLHNELISDHTPQFKRIVAVSAQFPLTLSPKFSINELSTIASYRLEGESDWSVFENGTSPLTFEDETTLYELEVTAQSGKTEVWKIGAVSLEPSAIDASMYFNYKELSATPLQDGVNVERYDIDFETGKVTIVIKEQESAPIQFPLNITIDAPTEEWLAVVGDVSPLEFTYDSWESSHSLILLDATKLKVVEWNFAIGKYTPREQEVAVEKAEITGLSCSKHVFGATSALSRSDSKPEPVVYESMKQIHLYYGSYYKPIIPGISAGDWWAKFNLNISLNNNEQIPIEVTWRADKNSSGKVTDAQIDIAVAATQTLNIELPDGTIQTWSLRLIKDDAAQSSECELMGIDMAYKLPNYLSFKEPICTVDQSASIAYFNIGDKYNFPITLTPIYQTSPFAQATPLTLYFENETAEQQIVTTAQDGVTTKSYTAKLILPQEIVAPDISSIEFGDLSVDATIIGEPTIDPENKKIMIPLETNSTVFPLKIPVQSVIIDNDGTTDLTLTKELSFELPNSIATTWVNSADGTARQLWSFEIFYYEQIPGSNMDNWLWGEDPVTSALPWSTPNMEGTVTIKNTSPVTGFSGTAGDYAAQMVTGETIGQLASGSIFTGWFDKANSTLLGLTDPVRLTHFGTPLAPDAKIKGISAQISYAHPSGKVDWGSLTVILINENKTQHFEFHGDKPNNYDDPTKGSAPHPNNTAVEVALSKLFVSNGSATHTNYGDQITVNTEAGEWTEVFIPISSDQDFTHISIAAASSAYGDYFIGQVGSVMRIDNIKIIYQ